MLDALEELTREQRRVVDAKARALEVVAGAGAGKTRVLAHRVARFGPDARSQARLLVVTFTREATASLHRRLSLLLGRDHHVRVGSFHQWAARSLPREGRAFIDEKDARRIVRDALGRRAPGEAFARALGVSPESRDDVPGRVLALLSFVKNAQTTLGSALEGPYAELASWRDLLEDVHETYEARKGERLDYDDLLLGFRDRLRRSRTFLREEQARWDHVFVDEFQDVNGIQAETVHLVTSGRSAPRVTVVGDGRQSIYGFRGARPEHLARFLEPYGASGRRLALTTNFRSTRALVHASNRALDAGPPMRARPRAPAGEAPRVLAALDPEDEARLLADEVDRLLAQDAQPEDVVVLARARHLAQPYLDEVARRVHEARHVAPDAADALVDAFLALRRARGDVPGLARADATRARERLRGSDAAKVAEALPALPWQDAAHARAARALARRARAVRLPARPGARELLDLPRLDALPDVRALTIHAAKGLEWDHVLLVGAREGGLPSDHALHAPAHVRDEAVEEERRLLYVALTRARRTFVATWARQGSRRLHEPCRWLAALAPPHEAVAPVRAPARAGA